jgi:hypothetical protein
VIYLDIALGFTWTSPFASQKLVWMNGPYKAGRSDKKSFVEDGLKQKLLQLGKNVSEMVLIMDILM